ncbi:MAG: hypothetical protein AUH17_07360 [Actinobacteria bacterium 13_2_20CM_68_14]|nr:MAG: hypothetical protein AUH17_07360 [Actinobacteria bacterium 13_2_20CM_68_14]
MEGCCRPSASSAADPAAFDPGRRRLALERKRDDEQRPAAGMEVSLDPAATLVRRLDDPPA